jgi:DnaJ-class molecular chaperone
MPGRRDDLASDHYALLGVARVASAAEVRRAFRTLALRHHPDRAGADSTELFQRIAAAYAILSDPDARSRYDDLLDAKGSRRGTVTVGQGRGDDFAGRPGGVNGAGEFEGVNGRVSWQVRRTRAPGSSRLDRVSGPLEALFARGSARPAGEGIVELLLIREEAEQGGHAFIDAAVLVTCPTCSGLARPDVLWCRRCNFTGAVMDDVTFTIELTPPVRDGTTFSFVTDGRSGTTPFRVRLRVNG